MQAVILAAGKSHRFYPFTTFGHKSMVPLFGKPLLQHTLEALKKSGFTEVVLVVGKDSSIPQKIEKVPGLHVQYVVQNETLGMGHALLQAEKYLQETFFLLSGYHADVVDFAQELQKKQASQKDIVLLVKEDIMLEKYGVAEVQNNKIISIEEKPQTKNAKGYRLVGIYLLNKTFLQVLNALPVEHYHFEKALDKFAKANNAYFVEAKNPTITLKHAWDLLEVKNYFLLKMKRSIAKTARIAKTADIQGNVVVSDNVTILEGVCIKGPCFLGENVVVGNNAILRNGVVVEANGVVGATMEVKNSILMQGVTTHTGFIGDSVIGMQTRLAAGFCSANVRFDRKEVVSKIDDEIANTHRTHIGAVIGESGNVGINVATMPGVYIGNNVTVGPGTYILENVVDDSLIYTKFQTVVKKKSS